MGVLKALNVKEVKLNFGSRLESVCFLPLIMSVSQRTPIFMDISKQTATRKPENYLDPSVPRPELLNAAPAMPSQIETQTFEIRLSVTEWK